MTVTKVKNNVIYTIFKNTQYIRAYVHKKHSKQKESIKNVKEAMKK